MRNSTQDYAVLNNGGSSAPQSAAVAAGYLWISGTLQIRSEKCVYLNSQKNYFKISKVREYHLVFFRNMADGLIMDQWTAWNAFSFSFKWEKIKVHILTGYFTGNKSAIE